MPLTPDDVVAGRYRVVRLLGRGGMADVHVARDERLGRDVALKALAHHLVDDEAAARRLRREATSIAALNHPNVVTLHDVLDTGGELVLVMELVEGQSLADRLRTDGVLPVRAAAAIAHDVAAGLAAAHERGIVHRDVKPANVLLTSGGRVKVADFGIARPTVVPTATTTSVMGTMAYVAPEHARGAAPDPRSDLYALGCVLVEMLTGEPPFVAATAAGVLAQHLEETPPVPSERRADVPPSLDRLVAALLRKEPDDRPGSAEEVAATLASVAAGRTSAGPAAEAPTTPLAAPAHPVAAATTPVADVAAEPGVASVTSTAPAGSPSGSGGAAEPVPREHRVTTSGRPRSWHRLVVGALAALAALVVAVWWTTADAPGFATADGGAPASPPTSPSPTTTSPPTADPSPAPATPPTPTRSPTPTPSAEPEVDVAPTTVADGVAALRAELVAGRGQGLVGADAAERIEDRIDELVRKVTDAGDDRRKRAEQADKQVDALAEELDERVDDGGLDERLAQRLRSRLERVASLLDDATDTGDDR